MNAILKMPVMVMVFVMATNTLIAADIGETLKDIDATGTADVSGAINAALASGRLDLHFPKGLYRLDRPLKLPSHAHITAAPDAHFYASRENEPEAIVQNASPDAGDTDISICGGLWDGCAPIHPRKGFNDLRYPGRFFLFINVDGLVLEHLRMTDVITYHIALGQVRHFRVEDISFEGIYPVKCQDGIHLCGGCEDGLIRHIRCLKGATYDDLIALNADEAFVYSHNNGFVPLPIRRIRVEDVEAPQCHTFVRLLSITNDISDITIRDAKVGYRAHGINADAARYCADPIFKDEDWPDGVGDIRNVLLENVTLWYAGPKTNVRDVVTFETNVSNFRFRNFTWAKDLEPPYVNQENRCFRFRKMCKTSISVDGKTMELPTGGELTLDGLHYDAIDVNRIDAPNFRK